MRLVTPGDSAPASVNRYLLPHETQVIMVRRHPAILMVPVGMVLGGLIVAGLLSNTIAEQAGQLANWVWWLWLALLAWFVWKVAEWSVDYFVITNQRMLLTTGLITRKVAMMPMGKVTDMSFERPIVGRMLGYGTFVLESAGQDQALRTVDYLPYPEQLYLETCELIFPDKRAKREEVLRGQIQRAVDEIAAIDRILGETSDEIHGILEHLANVNLLRGRTFDEIRDVLEHLATVIRLGEQETDPNEQSRLTEEKGALLDRLQRLHDQLEQDADSPEPSMLNGDRRNLLDKLQELHDQLHAADPQERSTLRARRRKLVDALRESHNELEQITMEKERARRPQVP
jgi:membrane protein YdbS with pleckstrin-like domain